MATAATRRTASKAAPAKATAARTTATKTNDKAAEKPVVVEMTRLDDTKRYSKWAWPDDAPAGCTGNVYAPLDATAVRVAIYGASTE